jgi:hypothetical protein
MVNEGLRKKGPETNAVIVGGLRQRPAPLGSVERPGNVRFKRGTLEGYTDKRLPFAAFPLKKAHCRTRSL